MAHPFQIACVCQAPQFGDAGLLLAACGPKIISVNLQSGSIISQWPAEAIESANQHQDTPKTEEPPGKKRKIEKPAPSLPNVIKLVISPDRLHAVAVTGDDKCIRVFEVSEDGSLVELSQRCMPKRPCAILVTPDNQTILCGDKFGDVYSLPLLPRSAEEAEEQSKSQKPQDSTPAKVYVPTATNLTVHTGRNRRALESQMRQKDLHAKSKEPLKFEHQLLLGHVSMLTDVQFATQRVDGRSRNFIITSDRDEHIRISRAAPQAHVIERYCLGHNEFISKLCLLPESNVLVSGGGDDWLGFWDWDEGRLLSKCDIKTALSGLSSKHESADGEADAARVAVSGLWTVNDPENGLSLVLVACEKVPAILAVQTRGVGSANLQIDAIELPGCPLDVSSNGARIIVSFGAAKHSSSRLQAYITRTVDSKVALEADSDFNQRLQNINALEIASPPSENLLYNIESMRKRGVEEDQETQEAI